MTDLAIDPCARELTRLQLLHAKLQRHARLKCGHSIEDLDISADGRASYCKACVADLGDIVEHARRTATLEDQLLEHAVSIRRELGRPGQVPMGGFPIAVLAHQMAVLCNGLECVARHANPGEARTFSMSQFAIQLAALAFMVNQRVDEERG